MATLVDRLRAQRESWVQLDANKAVLIRRPSALQILDVRNSGKGGIELAFLLAGDHVHDWRGFSEADVLGAAIGSSDDLEFQSDTWREIVSDSVDWANKVSKAIIDAVTEHNKKTAEASGN